MCAAMGLVMDRSSAQAAPARRRFRLLDVMILVAATAIGCGVIQSISRAQKRSAYDWCRALISRDPFYDELETILDLSRLTMSLVAPVTLALIPIRLLGARPRIRQLTRQPGLVASCAFGVAIAFIGLPLVVAALAAGARWVDVSRMLASGNERWSATMYGGLAVLVSWMTLVVGGRWRAERSWVDRFARAMGVYWIVTAFAVSAIFFSYENEGGAGFQIHSSTSTLLRAVGLKTLHVVTVIMPLVTAATLALIPMRLLSARPRFRRLARQPGLVASCAAGVAIALVGLKVVITVLASVLFADDGVSWQDISAIPGWVLGAEMVLPMTKCGGLAVLVSWTTLFVGRQWRAESGWADRLGRAMGFSWIMAAFALVSPALSNARNSRLLLC